MDSGGSGKATLPRAWSSEPLSGEPLWVEDSNLVGSVKFRLLVCSPALGGHRYTQSWGTAEELVFIRVPLWIEVIIILQSCTTVPFFPPFETRFLCVTEP